MYTAVAYILCVILIMVTILTRCTFINIFKREHISAVKIDMGYDKNMSFPVIPNLLKSVKIDFRMGSCSVRYPRPHVLNFVS